VVAEVREIQNRFDVVLVEGAGGLLSPLGENFSSRELAAALRAVPLIVCSNRIGVVNQARLTLEALPRRLAARAKVVFMAAPRSDVSARSNPGLLAEFIDSKKICELPWLGRQRSTERALADRRVDAVLRALLAG